MEENINIADILKDKPQGTKLYADAFGEVTIVDICTEDELGVTLLEKDGDELLFYNDGKYNRHGEPILFPSKEMDDWSKFAWKKGDVLVSEGMGRLHVIFEGFDDDTYTTFKGKHYLCNYDDNEDYNEEEYNDYHKELILRTIEFKKDNVNDAKAYINTIEERFGGKLNLETLEVEKHQPEFVDLKPKCEFKPFDRCIWKIRNCEGSIWRASFVSYVDEYGSIPMGASIDEDLINLIILPYNDETAKLIGTTNNWEG